MATPYSMLYPQWCGQRVPTVQGRKVVLRLSALGLVAFYIRTFVPNFKRTSNSNMNCYKPSIYLLCTTPKGWRWLINNSLMCGTLCYAVHRCPKTQSHTALIRNLAKFISLCVSHSHFWDLHWCLALSSCFLVAFCTLARPV